MDTRSVLLATINYDHPQNGMLRAFEYVFGKNQVFNFDYLERERAGGSITQINSEFVYAATAAKPDWIWLQVQETNLLKAETLLLVKKILPKTVITHWTGDYRPTVSPYLSSICRTTDVTFISSRGQRELFLEAGAKEVQYLQVGVDWEEDVLGLPSWEPPFRVPTIVFIGNFYGDAFPEGSKQRLQIIRAFRDKGLDIGVVGNGWPDDIPVVGTCLVKQQYHVYKRAKLALSINHINDVECYYSDRQLIAMASGTPVLAWRVPGFETEFNISGTVYSECETFTLVEEAVEMAERILQNHSFYSEYIGYNGRRAIMQRHDWRNRVLAAVDVVDLIRDS